ncbi:MAG: MATE family efflux transporter [Maricaulaceae bacterium]
MSWPVMLANAATPMVGFVDTLVIAHYSTTAALAGIGLGAVIYAIFYWGFGFLRMSTAGLVAQSEGQNHQRDVQAHLFRAVPLALIIGLIIFAAQLLLLKLLFNIFTANAPIEAAAREYIQARLWGLPAFLGGTALMGWFIGLGKSGRALTMQIWLNIVNIILSPLFVIIFGWGIFGVGIATAIADWAGLTAGLMLASREIKTRGGLYKEILTRKILLAWEDIRKLGVNNINIFIRTICLTIGFSFFGNAAASEGETFLAGYHILLQFITVIALILDGFAHTAEATVGAAFGAKNKTAFDRAVRLTSEFSFIFALICSAVILMLGPLAVNLLTPDAAVRASANTYLIYCALVPIVGFAAYQLDGIFIGTTQTAAMRNSGIAAIIIYLGAYHLLAPKLGPSGIWITFLIYYIARWMTMIVAYPHVRRKTEAHLS